LKDNLLLAKEDYGFGIDFQIRWPNWDQP